MEDLFEVAMEVRFKKREHLGPAQAAYAGGHV